MTDLTSTLPDPAEIPITDKMSPLEQQRLLAYLEQQYNACKQDRIVFERQWYINIAFYFGKQYVQWAPGINNNLTRLYEPPAPRWRVRLITNKIKPIVRREIAKFTKEKPQFYALPNSSEDADVAAAKAAESIATYQLDRTSFNARIRQVAFWESLCGTAFMKDSFNVSTGESQLEALSPFHLYVPNLQEIELENQPYVIHSTGMLPDLVEDRYGVQLSPDSFGSGATLEQKMFNSVSGSQKNNLVQVKEMWIKPCRRYPEGAVITWASGKLLYVHDVWPYSHNEFPFTKFDHIPTGRFYGGSVVDDLIPLQKEYNRSRSQVIEAKNRTSKPQLLVSRGSINPNKVTSEPGLMIEYTPGFPAPTPLQPVGLPNYVIQEFDRLDHDMMEISAQGEIARGDTPPGIEAASAIAYLQEESDSIYGPTLTNMEEGVQKVGKHLLSHAKAFWDEPRKVTVVGTNKAAEVHYFSMADIEGEIDLRVEAGSAMPRSLAAKQAFLFQLADRGLPLDRILKYLNMAESGKLYEEIHVDEQQIDRENLKLISGEAIGINTWDAHDQHILGHNNKRKTQEFELTDEQTKQQFEMHVMMHMMAMSGIPFEQIPQALEQMMAQQQMQQQGTLTQDSPLDSPVGNDVSLPMGGPTQPSQGGLQ